MPLKTQRRWGEAEEVEEGWGVEGIKKYSAFAVMLFEIYH